MLALVSFSFTACQQHEPEPEPITVVSNFAPGDNSHQSLPESALTAVRFHYHRKRDDGSYKVYQKWQIWAWDLTHNAGGAAFTFDHYDDYGVYVDIDPTRVETSSGMVEMGFLVAITSTWTKDPDTDRRIDIPKEAPGGILDIYLMTGSEKIYYDASTPLKNALDYASILPNASKEARLYFSLNAGDFTYDANKLGIYFDGVKTDAYTLGEFNSQKGSVDIHFNEDIDITKPIVIKYEFDATWTDQVNLNVSLYFDTESFAQKYYYHGDDLGATLDNELMPSKTTFKIWAPTSSKMTLNVYGSGDYINDVTPEEKHDLTMDEHGLWSIEINKNLANKYYTYTVSNLLGTHEVVDPYAKSAGLNGRRGMIVNFTAINDALEGWDNDERPDYGSSGVDASIYEIHVRDMTINPNSGVSEANRGKFLGLTETNTKYTEGDVEVTTGLDHLKELGVTHVQIQPFYDFSSVDESVNAKDMVGNTEEDKGKYNWGYDPLNYNALEGSYSTNPNDGNVRIKEFKQMVMALHEAGLNINMDVVYNHTSASETSNFNYLVPYYYYRTSAQGRFSNGSGCGNEVASEREMARKFIVDSVKFYTSEYHLSGFRFDLMGLIDNQTMIDVFNECKNIYPNIMVYGEPWTGGASRLESGTNAENLSSQQTVQTSLEQPYFSTAGVHVGAFADGMRNAVRGDNSPSLGWVQGEVGTNASSIIAAASGKFTSANNNIDPEQVINYVSCHDNYTLYDQLVLSNRSRNISKMYLQAEAVVFFSQGVPFMQEGEDFMRSKAYVEDGRTHYSHNSYNVGDLINNMDYSLKAKNVEMFNAFKELIKVRKDTAELRLSSREMINARVNNVLNNNGNLAFKYGKVDSSSKDILVIHSLNAFIYDKGVNGTILFDTDGLYSGSITGNIELQNNQTIVIALD